MNKSELKSYASFGILVFPDVQQLDLTGPYEVFASAQGSEVHLIWKERCLLTSSTGLRLMPTTTFDECPPLDVLCVPGGSGVNSILEDVAVLSFIRERATDIRYLTSVCTGALVLGAAGLLEGRKATTHWNAYDLLRCFGAIPTEGRIVQDGNLITAGGVTSGIDFGLAVIAELFGRSEAETIQLILEYAPKPPFNTGTPDQSPPDIFTAAKNRLAGSRKVRETIIEKITGNNVS